VSDEPQDSVAEQAESETTTEDPLAGFEESFQGLGFPQDAEGQPEPETAVDSSKAEESPAPEEAEKPEEAPAESKEEQEAEAEPTVNFDGLTDTQKATWERLLKAEAVTPEEFEEARGAMLRQADYTRKTQKLATERKAFNEERDGWGRDYDLLKQIKSDDRLHAIWMRMQQGDYSEADVEANGSDDLLSRSDAEKLVEERLKAREAEKQARTQKEQAAYDGKVEELREMAVGLMAEQNIPEATMNTYLNDVGQATPDGQDPVLYFSAERLREKILSHHEMATLKAENERLKKQAAQRTTKADRTSKQSSPPARRLSVQAAMTPTQKTLEELGVEADGSNVQGFGHPAGPM
jgi:hypothetical protein